MSRLEFMAQQVKLYNSSFFDARRSSQIIHPSLAVSCRRHVIVESHPRLVGEKAYTPRFAQPSLEVAMGLETVHPRCSATKQEIQPSEFQRRRSFANRRIALLLSFW